MHAHLHRNDAVCKVLLAREASARLFLVSLDGDVEKAEVGHHPMVLRLSILPVIFLLSYFRRHLASYLARAMSNYSLLSWPAYNGAARAAGQCRDL